ncbi:MAG: hypothetical protein ACWA5L_01300 [bacterium]
MADVFSEEPVFLQNTEVSFVRNKKRELSDTIKVKFLGCEDILVADRSEPSMVFSVKTTSMLVNKNGKVVPNIATNKYWISRRLGWWLKQETATGYIQALEIIEP